MTSRAERTRRARQSAAAKEDKSRPTTVKRNTAQILQGVTETFQMVELGLLNLLGLDPRLRMPGLRNLVVFGHATTQALQNIRSVDRVAFDEWYAPIQAEMRIDPLMKFFWDLRSQILKEGTTGQIDNSLHIHHLDMADLQPILSNPPPGAQDFFVGDALGGSGWHIRLPDGTMTTYYVALPDNISMDHAFHFQQAPTMHKGQVLTDTSVETLARLYMAELRTVVEQAQARFG
jgi:hypothetical protein